MSLVVDGVSSLVRNVWYNSGKTTAVLFLSVGVTAAAGFVGQYLISPMETVEQRAANAGRFKAVVITSAVAGALAPLLVFKSKYEAYSPNKIIAFTIFNIAAQVLLEGISLQRGLHRFYITNTRRACTLLAAPLLGSLGYLNPDLVTLTISGVAASIVGLRAYQVYSRIPLVPIWTDLGDRVTDGYFENWSYVP